MTLYPSALPSVEGRRCVLAAALTLTLHTPLAPQAYELRLLHQFVAGDLTIERVVALLEAPQEESRQLLPGEWRTTGIPGRLAG